MNVLITSHITTMPPETELEVKAGKRVSQYIPSKGLTIDLHYLSKVSLAAVESCVNYLRTVIPILFVLR